MQPIVHPDSLQFQSKVPSYWEATADPLEIDPWQLAAAEFCDVAIIGGGVTGLSAALELAEAGVDVALLEAGPIGWGASGRNGGFACLGSHKLPYKTMIRRYGLEATKAYYSAMKASVDLVAEHCQRHGIDAWAGDRGEAAMAHLPNRYAVLADDQAFMRKAFGEESELLPKAALRERGMDAPHFHGALLGQKSFGIHPLNYVRGLARAAEAAGARLHASSPVILWEERDGRHVLETPMGKLTAKKVIVATNGYTPEQISSRHAGRLLPALSSIMVTRPLSEDERRAQGWTTSLLAYDSRNLLHYFRLLPDGRFLFGGRGGTDSSDAGGQAYRQQIEGEFRHLFPAWKEAEITHFWRGFVCLSRDRVPYVGALDERKSVWTSIAYHGNGVAMGTWSGRAVARLLMDKAAPGEVPAVITRRLARFPLPAFRPLYLKGAYAWFGLKDRR